MFSTPLRQARLAAEFGEEQGGERRVFGGFQDDGVAGGERGGDFPRQHQQREVPGDHRAADAQRGHAGLFGRQELGEARVVVEMPGDKRDVDVAAFADRLAVVHRFQHGEQAGVFLDEARQGVEVLRALMRRQARPFRLGAAGGRDGGVDVLCAALRDLGKALAGGGVRRGEGVARLGEGAVDPVAEAVAMRR